MVFCDEINLPTEDKYGTQQVILWIRQVVEYGGFFRPGDKEWVTVERVLFLGACNPPTDAGRFPLSVYSEAAHVAGYITESEPSLRQAADALARRGESAS